MKAFEQYVPTRALFGWGRVSELGGAAAGLGRKALVMTFQFLVDNTGCVSRAVESLTAAGVEHVLFPEVEENPPIEMLLRAVEIYKREGCDLVVSIGGGSALDSGKAVAAAATNRKPLVELIGMNNVQTPAGPHIAVPTTAGTGSEVTRYCIITEGGVKKGITSELIYPTAALVDPELTMTMPPGVTANTGLDVLAHAVEGFVSVNATPVTDALALDAMTLVGRHLVTAFTEPGNREAREAMSLASMLGGFVIAHAGTGLMHSMGFPLTVDFGKPHGLACALLMAPVMEFSIPSNPEKYAMIAAALGRDVRGMDAGSAARESIAAVEALFRALGVDAAPTALEFTDEKLDGYVEAALANKRFLANVPRTPTADDVRALYLARR